MHSAPCSTPRSLGSAALRWWNDESGVTAIEYGLMASLIVLVAIVGYSAFGAALKDFYDFWTQMIIDHL